MSGHHASKKLLAQTALRDKSGQIGVKLARIPSRRPVRWVVALNASLKENQRVSSVAEKAMFRTDELHAGYPFSVSRCQSAKALTAFQRHLEGWGSAAQLETNISSG